MPSQIEFLTRSLEVFLPSAIAEFARKGAESGDAVLLVVTGPHWLAAERALARHGEPLERWLAFGQLQVLDAEDTLAAMSKRGRLDEELFQRLIGAPLFRALVHHRRVRVFGETLNLLRGQGRTECVERLEGFWTRIARIRPYSIMLGFRFDALGRGPLSLDCGRFARALGGGLEDVLGANQAALARLAALRECGGGGAKDWQVLLPWLAANMPVLLPKILERTRVRYESAAPRVSAS